jgi:methylenetetrahydrofolate dehydrogenase (NADP+)/methenyltetrahydrofolate cyclohydrolase
MTLEISLEPLTRAAAAATPPLLDGRAVAAALRAQLAAAVERLAGRGHRPTLALVRVGDDEASEIYVRFKVRACRELGIRSIHRHFEADVDRDSFLDELDDIVAREDVDGVLVQLPLPPHLPEEEVIERIEPGKDVDGFHPLNLGRLMAGRARLEPCTPRGIMTLLRAADVLPLGRRAVVIGRSRIVGRPMAQMLMRADATVTVCHRHTRDLEAEVRRAEILVVATGVAGLVPGSWIREGAVVIDVGITRLEDGSLGGDVEFERARDRASRITPVPGGVGPMTVATLMENTVRAAATRAGFTPQEPLTIAP